MYLDSYISKSPTGWLLYAGFFWASNCGLNQVAVDVSHPPQANEQVWAYSFISNDRKAIYMEANPWYFLRNRLTPGTVLVLPICNWPKKTTWLSPVSILWRKRILIPVQWAMESHRKVWRIRKRKCNLSHKIFLLIEKFEIHYVGCFMFFHN